MFQRNGKKSCMSQGFVDYMSMISRHATWRDVFSDSIPSDTCALDYLFWDVQFGIVLLYRSFSKSCHFCFDKHPEILQNIPKSKNTTPKNIVERLSWCSTKNIDEE